MVMDDSTIGMKAWTCEGWQESDKCFQLFDFKAQKKICGTCYTNANIAIDKIIYPYINTKHLPQYNVSWLLNVLLLMFYSCTMYSA